MSRGEEVVMDRTLPNPPEGIDLVPNVLLPDLATPERLAAFTGLDPVDIVLLCESGELPAAKVAGKWVIERLSLLEWLAEERQRQRRGSAKSPRIVPLPRRGRP